MSTILAIAATLSSGLNINVSPLNDEQCIFIVGRVFNEPLKTLAERD
jgi:hypothetical protein